MSLFSYCILYDNGAAPNPFWNLCTLAICKPVVRRTAQEGDWIVATGSKQYGFENQMVYAMKVTNRMTFEQYDSFCKISLPNKIPIWKTQDLKLRVGDCIYDYSKGEPTLRPGVHGQENKKTDLGGKNVLLSDHFYYFGSQPITIPASLLHIVKQGPGHKSKSNEPYIETFLEWITGFAKYKNKITAIPYGLEDFIDDDCVSECDKQHKLEDEEDEMLVLNKAK
jgi:hypothetical protein